MNRTERQFVMDLHRFINAHGRRTVYNRHGKPIWSYGEIDHELTYIEKLLANPEAKNWRQHLGEIISPYIEAHRATVECHEDIHMWSAPSECHADECRAYEQTITALNQYTEDWWGVTIAEVEEELKARVSAKWLFQYGIGHMI